jgi:hypothetical protein
VQCFDVLVEAALLIRLLLKLDLPDVTDHNLQYSLGGLGPRARRG